MKTHSKGGFLCLNKSMGWLDFIFPKQCVACKRLGSYLCDKCLAKVEYLKIQICPYCYKPAINGATHPRCLPKNGLDGVVSLTNYQTPMRELVKALKYRLTTDVLPEIANKLQFDLELVTLKNAIVLPLPLSQARQNFRGFNQSELLGQMVADKFGLNFASNLVARARSTKSQVGLSQKQRSENVKNAFRVEDEVWDQDYYIFDDVWTSGATLKEVAVVLKKAGAREVWGLTLAHPR